MEQEPLLFNDIKKKIESNFIESGEVMIYGSAHNFKVVSPFSGLYSALVSPENVSDALKNHTWECKFSNKGFEPLIYIRDEMGQYNSYLELSEEFRLYYNLYEKFESHEDKEYIYIDNNGDEEIVVKIGKQEAFIKLKFLKDYISVRQMHFFIYFDFMRFSNKTLTELSIKELNENFSTDTYFYNHLIRDIGNGISGDPKTQSWIMGKSLIKNIKDYKRGTIEERNKYCEFIIDYDENGNEKYFTCDEEKLGNYFGKNPDAPLYVEPVFFKKEVLTKYYNNPNKYSVIDGYISCVSLWGIRIDNNNRNYVAVMIGELSKLHYKEQLYWKHFNIPPEKDMRYSRTAFMRGFAGRPCNPESPDLLLKMKLRQFNKAWLKKYSWYLFKPLSEKDHHYLESLHLLTSAENQKEFNEQILALTKIFIDSLNEKEMIKGIKIENDSKGIDKLQSFLESKNLKVSQTIEFYKNIQELRSSTVAHRKSEKINKKIHKYFEFENRSLSEILEGIFGSFIEILDAIEHRLMKST